MDEFYHALDHAVGKVCAVNDEFYFLKFESEFDTEDGRDFQMYLKEAVRDVALARMSLRNIRDKMKKEN